MNRVLQQRFNQISRQNNYMMAAREAQPARRDTTTPKPSPIRHAFPNEAQPVGARRH